MIHFDTVMADIQHTREIEDKGLPIGHMLSESNLRGYLSVLPDWSIKKYVAARGIIYMFYIPQAFR